MAWHGVKIGSKLCAICIAFMSHSFAVISFNALVWWNAWNCSVGLFIGNLLFYFNFYINCYIDTTLWPVNVKHASSTSLFNYYFLCVKLPSHKFLLCIGQGKVGCNGSLCLLFLFSILGISCVIAMEYWRFNPLIHQVKLIREDRELLTSK